MWEQMNKKENWPPNTENNMAVVFCQQWEESERGWGVRPDGYSLHLTLADANDFRLHYMEHQKEWFESHGIDGVPDEYTRPCGDPYRVLVSEELYQQLMKDKSIRFNDNIYPEKAGWQQ